MAKALVRRKTIDDKIVDQSQLKRCLSFFDLTCLGIGSTLGLGVYMLAGQVAGKTAGPSVCLSFAIAAAASLFAGLCYAELGSRVPRAGSAYLYSYVTVGEFMAFVIGWNLVLEYIIGKRSASIARGYTVYIDALCDNKISKYFTSVVPINVNGFAPFPDPISFTLTLGLSVLLALGVKESIRLHTLMTIVNLSVVVFVIIAGCFKANIDNWKINKDDIPVQYTWAGNGGFFPNGFSGMIAGAATCFYAFVGFDAIATTAFVGFDAIATTGEEAKNPKRNIPLSICLSLLIITLVYFAISAVQTLMYPYYLQHPDITNGAALPYVFDKVGWTWAMWVVSVGAIMGLSTNLLGTLYPLPRVLYAMGTDGVIFRFMATVNGRFKTPVYATLIAGLFAATMAAIFDVDQLQDMMSIGTLLAYTLVAISILVIRYSNRFNEVNESNGIDNNTTVWRLVLNLTVYCLLRQPMIQKSQNFEVACMTKIINYKLHVPGVPFVPLLSWRHGSDLQSGWLLVF
ncbi:unnamed protein product [Medioppia subpectinata]|uniref:Uncharacterized protein n=1 Tax=Medioppia subpectinata TaxID=1979941 RepID=A0A7R9KUL8_9ACAR|nr:unnamed protein product [Medioppia subpectinata]CAG2110183.1 unnamed protein product [Medioppia subpectinata]